MNYKYEGYSTKRYQYDLSKAEDKKAYSMDFDAQKRDKNHLDVGGDIKRDKLHNKNLAGVEED